MPPITRSSHGQVPASVSVLTLMVPSWCLIGQNWINTSLCIERSAFNFHWISKAQSKKPIIIDSFLLEKLPLTQLLYKWIYTFDKSSLTILMNVHSPLNRQPTTERIFQRRKSLIPYFYYFKGEQFSKVLQLKP